jgi:PhnB protein
MPSSRVPEEFHTITPHIIVKGVPEAVAFYGEAFGAKELYRNVAPDGSVIHSEMLLGDSRFFMHDEFPDYGALCPASIGKTAVTLHLYVDDVDTMWRNAVGAGATVDLELEDKFWGDRYGMLTDPFGHSWSLASRIEDISPAETNRRSAEYYNE